MSYLQMLLIVCPLIFLASFVDSIAGGGGLISLPAYMLTGIPMHTAYGCNKFSACLGTGFSVIRFYKNAKIHVKSAVASAIFCTIGAYLGSTINLYIDGELLKKIVVVILPIVAIVVLFGGKKQVRAQMLEGKRLYITCAAIGLVIGIYDGIIGPGTGTFLILAYTSLVGFDFVTASGNAKVANLASNIASTILFIINGKVFYALAIPATLFSILGGWIGSGLAIKKGSKLIKVILILVLIGIFAKLIFDILN